MGEHKQNPRVGRPLCATCLHFNPGDEVGEKHGHCHKGLPYGAIITKPGKFAGALTLVEQGYWPPVLPTHFCGEHSEFHAWLALRNQMEMN